MKTRHILLAFAFILLTIFLLIIVFSRSSEARTLAHDNAVPDAGVAMPDPTTTTEGDSVIDVNPAPTKKSRKNPQKKARLSPPGIWLYQTLCLPLYRQG